jgi:holo-[acyl-carrier protein] synthase
MDSEITVRHLLDLCRKNDRTGLWQYSGFLTPAEQEEFHARKSAHRKTEYLGGRFAAKEAIFKATGDQMFLSYSVLTEVSGKPYVKDHPELDVSISHDGGFAIAAVLCLKSQKGMAQ